jgi:hypothetical protein
MKIESRIGKSMVPVDRIYKFASDFRNFNNFIPEDKISNWKADEDECSFSADMIGNVKLQIVERETNKLIKITSDPAVNQYNFNLWLQFKEQNSDDTRIKITIEPLVNKFLLPMVKGPLKSFVDSLVDEIENFDFKTTI